MYLLRPIQKNDFRELKHIAEESGHGFTSLPVDDGILQKKIFSSNTSFAKTLTTPENESYLFVLVDTVSNKIIGTTGIESSVGKSVPIYHYHLGKTVHHSSALNIYNTVDILTMCNDYTGSSEICSLFLREDFRKGLAGRFLSRSRFLFMSDQAYRFSERVIAEMRGISDENGQSPFWHWLQEFFFGIEFPQADHLVGLGQKVFISELMPKYPIYTSLLSKEAQNAIGEVHTKTKPALNLLEKEGFEHRGYVDLFDAGPTIEAKLSNIKTVRESMQPKVNIKTTLGPETLAITNQKLVEFKATFSNKVILHKSKMILDVDPEVADALSLSNGDQVRISIL